MKIHFITIVLDGMPFIAHHLPIFNTLNLDWHWHIIEGVAKNVNCTKWCKPIPPRLSLDGTTEYLDSIAKHSRVNVYRRVQWEGKHEMVNAPFKIMKGEALVWQVDSDELWTKQQIERVHALMLENKNCSRVQFKCRYFFGPDIVITSDNTYGNHHAYEWFRVWRWREGETFGSHEPPVMTGPNTGTLDLKGAPELQFQHYAYVNEDQVAFKEVYYGYADAVAQWRKLQDNRKWPARLADYCQWVKDETIVDKL